MLEPDGPRRADRREAHSPAPAIFVAPVIRLRRIRTLVISRDLAFRRRAMTVLVELGFAAFAVLALDATDEVVELVEQQRADVVMLDATGCAALIAPIVTALLEVAPRVGVVVVADEVDRAVQSLIVAPKWGWAADLSRAVRAAYDHGNPLKEEVSDVRYE